MSNFTNQVVLGRVTIRTLRLGGGSENSVLTPNAPGPEFFQSRKTALDVISRPMIPTAPLAVPAGFTELDASIEQTPRSPSGEGGGERAIRRFRDESGRGIMLVQTELGAVLQGRDTGVLETLSCLSGVSINSRQGAILWQGINTRSEPNAPGTGIVQLLWENSQSYVELFGPVELLEALQRLAESQQ